MFCCCRFKELVPGLDSSLGNDEIKDFCHSVIGTTNRLVQNITDTQWLKSIALRMATIYGVDVNGYIVSIYDDINDQSLSCTCVGVGRRHH